MIKGLFCRVNFSEMVRVSGAVKNKTAFGGEIDLDRQMFAGDSV